MNPQTYTEEKFARLAPPYARQYAGRCRAVCAKLGVPVPAWAAQTTPTAPAPKPRPPKLAAGEQERAFTNAAHSGFVTPAELASWRARTGGVVCFEATGRVTLIRWDGGERFEARFPSSSDAVEALRTGSFRWEPQKTKPIQQATAVDTST
jgi:hypothetical protein